MKSFVIALLIFGLLLTVIACNFFFINATADELEARLADLKAESADEQIPVLCDCWARRRTLMSFSIANGEMQNFQDRLTALCTAADFRDPAEFERARALALGAVSDLRRLERFSVENLL